MVKYLVLLFPFMAFCSEESKKKEGMDAVYELYKKKPETRKTCKRLEKIDELIIDRIKKLHDLKAKLAQTKTISLDDLADADTWITEVEMISTYFADNKESCIENKEAIVVWREFFKNMAVELSDLVTHD